MDLGFDKSPLSFATGICLRLAFNQCAEGTSSKSVPILLPSRETCLSERHPWFLKQEKDICSMIAGTTGVSGTSRLE